MTHSLISAAEALLNPKRLYSVMELRELPTLIPQEGGVYAWWFSKAPPGVTIDGTAEYQGRHLLYVGIAPRKPSAAGGHSKRTLRHRLLNHCRGPVASSTLRRTLAVLLTDELDLSLMRTNSGKLKMLAGDEGRLTHWMTDNARVTWSVNSAPWEVEDHLIKDAERLPLNIRGSADPFAMELSKLRSQVQ